MDLLGIFGWVGTAIASQVTAVVSWVASSFGVLYGDIAQVDSFAGGLGTAIAAIFGNLRTWLFDLWNWIHDNIIVKLRDLFNRLHDLLEKILGPILKHVRAAIAMYRWYWLHYIKPLFDFLQRVRRALVIFRLLGFQWAKDLDAKIAQLESAITRSFLGVLANLNTIANWINYILDPFGLIQPNVWLSSIKQSIGAMLGLGYGTMHDPGFASSPMQYSTPADFWTASNMSNRFKSRSAGGTLPEDDACVASLRASATSLGYKP
jgi:hypothetical protein